MTDLRLVFRRTGWTRRRLSTVVRPCDRWQGRTFVTAEGEQFEVVWDGSKHAPSLLADRVSLNIPASFRHDAKRRGVGK